MPNWRFSSRRPKSKGRSKLLRAAGILAIIAASWIILISGFTFMLAFGYDAPKPPTIELALGFSFFFVGLCGIIAGILLLKQIHFWETVACLVILNALPCSSLIVEGSRALNPITILGILLHPVTIFGILALVFAVKRRHEFGS